VAEGGARLQLTSRRNMIDHNQQEVSWSDMELNWRWYWRMTWKHSSQTTVWTKLMCIHILHAVISRYQVWPLHYHFCNRWWAIATCLNYQRTCNYRELKLHWMDLLRKEHSSVLKLGLSHGLLLPPFFRVPWVCPSKLKLPSYTQRHPEQSPSRNWIVMVHLKDLNQ
jgi:hypothetical protein